MASADRRARERAATREKILAAARDLFVRDGFEAVTMRGIAEAIEYTPPAIYTHFKDKHELLLALCDADFGMLSRQCATVSEVEDPVERVRQMGKAYVRFALDHPHHYRFMFMTPWPAPDEDLKQRVLAVKIENAQADRDGYAHLRNAVKACIDGGHFRPGYRNVETVTQLCWGAAHGVVSLYLTHGNDPWLKFQPPLKTACSLVDATIDGMIALAATPRTAPRSAPRAARAGRRRA